jgi:glycosyltransferase involved in cell wall biosynthesis
LLNKNISIVIPAYNEEKRIINIIKDIQNQVSNLYEIIVVFDGNDKTPEIVKETCPDCTVLQFNHRLGKGRAIIEGINEAKGELVAFIDADGAIPASEIVKLEEHLTDSNFVVSSRWLKSSQVNVRQPLHRVFFGRVFHYFVFLMFRINLKDTQCGLKMFNTKDAKEIVKSVKVFDWSFDVSLIYHAIELGLTPFEVGIIWNNEEGSKLKIFKTIPRMFLSVAVMWVVNKHGKTERLREIIKKIETEFLSQ